MPHSCRLKVAAKNSKLESVQNTTPGIKRLTIAEGHNYHIGYLEIDMKRETPTAYIAGIAITIRNPSFGLLGSSGRGMSGESERVRESDVTAG
jgi:hypothetical protein